MPRLAFAVVALVAFTGCQKTNPDFCPSGPNSNGTDCIDGGTGGPCKTRNDCTGTPDFPVCDTADSGGTCVQCTIDDHTFCRGLKPHCEDRACVGCIDDSDCGDPGVGVCLPTGGCADPSSIIHAVSSGGLTTGPCGGIGVGNACTLNTALTLATSTKHVIKLDDAGPYISAVDNFVVDTAPAIELTIDARGAVLHRNSIDSAILTINSGKAATILGGTIEGATGSGGDGIRCNANAILVVDGTILRTNDESAIENSDCMLTVSGAEIRSNSSKSGGILYPGIQVSGGSITISRSAIASNRGGGIVVNNNGKFAIIGNIFLSNGDSLASVGGVSINTTGLGNRLEFNTITENKSDMALAAGVQCTLTGGFTSQNNIIWNNNSTLGTNGIQVNGCLYAYSDIGPTILPTVNDGLHNMNFDPTFVDGLTNLHLQPGTMVRGKANPDTDLTGIASKDMDGKTRIRPADLGAYVAPPQ